MTYRNKKKFIIQKPSRAVTLTGPGMAQTNVYNGLDTRVGSTTNSVANTYLRNGAYVAAPVIKDSTATFTPGVLTPVVGAEVYDNSDENSWFAPQQGWATYGAGDGSFDGFGATIGTGPALGIFREKRLGTMFHLARR